MLRKDQDGSIRLNKAKEGSKRFKNVKGEMIPKGLRDIIVS